jgi:phosphoglycerol transferase MdoB-like AlkP superfamily enzyme
MIDLFMKYFSAYIPAFKISLAALLAFTAYRFVFLLFNLDGIPPHPDDPAFLYYRSLLYGINFDLVIICYIISPFVIFCFVQQLSQQPFVKAQLFFKWYFILLFSVCFFICAADIPYYKQFATHLNKDVFNWASSPGFILKLVFSSFSYWGFLFLFIVLIFFVYRRVSKIQTTVILKNPIPKGAAIGIFVLMALITFIGMRGRTALKSPIKTGTAFFSEYAFFNQLGLNPCFVFFNSLKHQQEWPFLKDPFTDAEFDKTMQQLTSPPKKVKQKIERDYTFNSPSQKFNVIVVLMESMAMTKMGYHHCTHLTNRFDTLVKQGVFFDNFYSAGIHTFNGLFSTETGFPAIMNIHPLENYTTKAFKGLSYWLKQNDYSTNFFTCHDGQFDNMEGFMKFNHFDHFYSQNDYPSDKAISTLGVPDHYLFEYALEKMDAQHREKNTPFFSYILTSSDHGPWVVPTDIPFKPTAVDEHDRSTQYADWALGYFIDKAKKYDWFNNTLFVFVADHGVNFGHTYAMPLSYNHIPCLFYMPSQLKPDTISSLGGQIDMLPTVLSFLKIPFKNTSMGIDLMHEKRPWMYFTADSKIGAINEKFYYFDLLDEQKEMLYQFKDLDTENYIDDYKTKADSMKKYAVDMIRAADHIIKQKLY